MSEAAGRSTPVSLGRRITCDFLHAGMQVPLVSIQKTMNLGGLPAARQAARPRPSWCAVFTKAFARVVAARPDLRRAFLTFPRERIYHEPTTTADIVVEARVARKPSSSRSLSSNRMRRPCRTSIARSPPAATTR